MHKIGQAPLTVTTKCGDSPEHSCPTLSRRGQDPIKVALVDDQEDIRITLAERLHSFSDIEITACFGNSQEALLSIAQDPPDLVLMDIRMPGMSGIECTARLKSIRPKLPVLIFSAFADCSGVLEAFLSGANGFLLKTISTDELARAIRETVAGATPIANEVRHCLVELFHRFRDVAGATQLSQRERQVLVGVFEGKLDKEIAADLKIGAATVHTHVHSLFSKFGVHSRQELIRKFLQLGNNLS